MNDSTHRSISRTEFSALARPCKPENCDAYPSDEADRATLYAALRDSDADIEDGRLVDAAKVLQELRSS